MLLHIPDVLTPDELRQMRDMLRVAPWADGRSTAGRLAADVKNNEQLPMDSALLLPLQGIVLGALRRHAGFFSAALPRRLLGPMFNRYSGATNAYGNHFDQALRSMPDGTERLRTDVSCTLFLSDPADYDGGELVIEDAHSTQRVKLPAGHLVVYPASNIHRVEPVTRGQRVASFFWIESLVRSTERRRLLYDMDMALVRLREREGASAEAVVLSGVYHNLLRMWCET